MLVLARQGERVADRAGQAARRGEPQDGFEPVPLEGLLDGGDAGLGQGLVVGLVVAAVDIGNVRAVLE